MAYLPDPGTVLSNARFGPNAFVGSRTIFQNGATYEEDPTTGNWNLINYQEPYRGDFDNSPTPPPPPQTLTPDQVDTSAATWSGGLSGQGLESIIAQGHSQEALTNPDNIKVLGKDPKTGGYLVMSKSGDKQGTIYAVMPTPDGSYMSAGVVQNNVPWDTNNPWWKGALPIFMVAAGPLFLYGGEVIVGAANALATGAATTISEALSMGVQAANAAGAVAGAAVTFPTGVADEFMLANTLNLGAGAAATGTTNWTGNLVSDYVSGAAPGETAGRFVGNANYAPTYTEAFDAAQLLNQGLSPDAVIQNLVGTGLDEMVAADIVQLVQQGIPETQIMDIITKQYPPSMQNPGMPNTVPPPGTPGSPVSNPPPFEDNYPPPPTDSGPPPKPPGTTPPGAPTGSPSGTQTGTNQGNNAWMLPLILADMYNKYAMGKNTQDTMSAWAEKIFGKSADFESNLMNTYQNPQAYYAGPEFTALRDIVSRRENRTASNLGRLTNPTVPDYVTTKALVENMNNYRTGLVNSANVGRAASGPAMEGMGRALGGQAQAASWYSPATFAAGNQGSNNPGQTVQDFWNMGSGVWDWLKGQKWPWEG